MQDKVFWETEGDNYWRRNASALEKWNPTRDHCLQLLDMYRIVPQHVLEIGAASGFRLLEIKRKYSASATGVEPSEEAVNAGLQIGVDMIRGTAAEVPIWHQQFDLVIVNFVLHWVDRQSLFRSVAEIDRLLQDGGFLLLGDFLPTTPSRTKYHHRPSDDMWTYKQNYAEFFMVSGLYRLVGMVTGDHGGELHPCPQERDRIGTWLLRKTLHSSYATS